MFTKCEIRLQNGNLVLHSTKYIHGTGGLQALSHGEKNYFVITDRLGYTRVVAECKKIIQAYHYKPFGEAVKVIQESELVNLLFGGYELDKETGLYYAKSRIFDPDSYRFLSPDPDGEFPSPYIFCGNDPFAVIDENGERSWYAALIGTVIGIVLTIGLSVLTMGAAAQAAIAVFGAGGTSITAATTAAKTAAIVAYNTAMTFAVTAVSGFAAEGVKSLIDGEPYTASSVYDMLLGATASTLVFGGAGSYFKPCQFQCVSGSKSGERCHKRRSRQWIKCAGKRRIQRRMIAAMMNIVSAQKPILSRITAMSLFQRKADRCFIDTPAFPIVVLQTAEHTPEMVIIRIKTQFRQDIL